MVEGKRIWVSKEETSKCLIEQSGDHWNKLDDRKEESGNGTTPYDPNKDYSVVVHGVNRGIQRRNRTQWNRQIRQIV